jgi:hypothetical protein
VFNGGFALDISLTNLGSTPIVRAFSTCRSIRCGVRALEEWKLKEAVPRTNDRFCLTLAVRHPKPQLPETVASILAECLHLPAHSLVQDDVLLRK